MVGGVGHQLTPPNVGKPRDEDGGLRPIVVAVEERLEYPQEAIVVGWRVREAVLKKSHGCGRVEQLLVVVACRGDEVVVVAMVQRAAPLRFSAK